MRSRIRRTIGLAVATGLWTAAYAPLAHAHGGMVGPEELGPPLTISFCLAFVSYWLMIWWPSSKNRDEVQAPAATKIEIRKPAGRSAPRLDPFRARPVRLVKKVTSDDSSGTVER